MSFRVDLNQFRGPIDLLLYLVRKHELDILNLPLADVTMQYLEHLTVLEQLSVNDVGDFIEVASLLIEIKSRSTLPRVEEEVETFDDPREELVQRLLEYKKYKDVSSMLEERGQEWQQSYSRLANDLPGRKTAPSEQPIRDVELWDLVSALGRVMKQGEAAPESNIVYDDIPVHVHMKTIYERLTTKGPLTMTEVLQAGMPKTDVIGLFLAVLELVRHHSVLAIQSEDTDEIVIQPGPNFSDTLDLDRSGADDYRGGASDAPASRHA